MRKLLIGTTLFLVLAFFLNACGGSATTAPGSLDFKVHVTDSANAPLSGAKVVSQSQPDGQLKISGLTDAQGNVSFDSIRGGDYTLYVTRFDYNQVQVAITITPANAGLTVKMSLTVTPTLTPTAVPLVVTFGELTGQPQNYAGQFVTLECFYFSGFEISALTAELVPASYNPGNLTPQQPLIWVSGNQGQAVYDNLFKQSETPSGYPETFGKVRITGRFLYGGHYGHLDAYNYQLEVTSSELLPWTPPGR